MVGTVLLTNASGSSAQDILRTWSKKKLAVRVVGLQMQEMSAANLFCDKVYSYPAGSSFIEPDIDFLAKLCLRESVQLIIPTTDEETVSLQCIGASLPPVACSVIETSKVFADKFSTWDVFKSHGIPFVRSVLPSKFRRAEFPREIIAKPRTKKMSRDVYRNPQYPEQLSDDFVIQEGVRGTEILVGFYVTREGTLHGHITFERSLAYRSTASVVVAFKYQDQVQAILQQLCKSLPLRGSYNLQAIVRSNGEIVPFAITGRPGDSNAAQAAFGFADSIWLVNEWLYRIAAPSFVVTPGLALVSDEYLVVPTADPTLVSKNSHYFRV